MSGHAIGDWVATRFEVVVVVVDGDGDGDGDVVVDDGRVDAERPTASDHVHDDTPPRPGLTFA